MKHLGRSHASLDLGRWAGYRPLPYLDYRIGPCPIKSPILPVAD